ncbi:hypothetical protein Q648_00772 [Bartonella quintana JK 12]|uniref:Uncharacterized protein n=1 Tax=Bartonella quintana JK 68 TaxID=1134503 RepID=A0ABR4STD0_BARQI|nr:hypothetical protein Q651_01267 [Bartonella quintana BQ2-D70]ETS18233.1 hypothetical protein Q647_01182 [Bartonella quintana JK 7]ETS19063.1 hypothetical protein Q648_00772 [Bartonella quintana JK 12]KEC60874.1 hypothetical protein O91_01056 [Bartonella quintana JK 31]KEC61406.1 hypothetical protein O7Y_01174 [Bartonella quintana JK 63]KEC64663.1 hypothetical protein O7W_00706 [Bartonella quintana JK 56]KEC66729.1 hypothetical protein O7S_00745 [Bartonella quintana JK 67]KEC67929.1 hypoth
MKSFFCRNAIARVHFFLYFIKDLYENQVLPAMIHIGWFMRKFHGGMCVHYAFEVIFFSI